MNRKTVCYFFLELTTTGFLPVQHSLCCIEETLGYVARYRTSDYIQKKCQKYFAAEQGLLASKFKVQSLYFDQNFRKINFFTKAPNFTTLANRACSFFSKYAYLFSRDFQYFEKLYFYIPEFPSHQ